MSTLVTPEDCARHLRRRMAAAAADGARRAAALRARLPEAVACLRERYGVGAVWLFGSLANGTCRADSDVDLAVRGLESHRYFAALADTMRILAAPVDLVSIEAAPAPLAERIRAEGEPL